MRKEDLAYLVRCIGSTIDTTQDLSPFSLKLPQQESFLKPGCLFDDS